MVQFLNSCQMLGWTGNGTTQMVNEIAHGRSNYRRNSKGARARKTISFFNIFSISYVFGCAPLEWETIRWDDYDFIFKCAMLRDFSATGWTAARAVQQAINALCSGKKVRKWLEQPSRPAQPTRFTNHGNFFVSRRGRSEEKVHQFWNVRHIWNDIETIMMR